MQYRIPSQIARLLTIPTLILATACGNSVAPLTPKISPNLPPLGTVAEDNTVVQSRAYFAVDMQNRKVALRFLHSQSIWNVLGISAAYAATGSQNVTVTNSPSTSMSLDQTQFTVPMISNALLSFGFLAVDTLFDNNLNVCGSNGRTKCNQAMIRMYTTGQDGAGIYNSTDQFGAPITAGHEGGPSATIGLSVSNAAVLQSYAIPNSQHVMRQTDFSPAPRYAIDADFRQAGTGTYTTTLVVEYVLAP